MNSWTFLTNHAHVLLCIARDPGIRLRDVATEVQITERAAQRIVAELVAAGYISRTREGRRNHYDVHGDLPLRHPLDRHHAIGELLELIEPNAAVPARLITRGRGSQIPGSVGTSRTVPTAVTGSFERRCAMYTGMIESTTTTTATTLTIGS